MSFVPDFINPFISDFISNFSSFEGIPAQIPNLSAWWDASDESTFTYTSGITVSSWTDKSPNKWVLAGSGNRPDRIANGIGGKPAVQFVAADSERLFFTPSNHALLDPQTGGFTGFVVLDIDTTTNVFGIISKGNATGSFAQGWALYGEGAALNLFRIRSFDGTTRASQSRAISTDPLVLGFTFTGAEVLGYLNNSNASWTDGGGGPTDNIYSGSISTTSDFVMGVLNTSYGNIRIAEVLLYKRVLTTQERAAVHAYLYGKYGIVA